MDGYDLIAGCYNRFTRDVDYAALADYVESAFARVGAPPEIVLELGCGSGSLTVELARRGYDMIGVDRSPGMLAQAYDAARDVRDRALFLQQDMRALDLYGTVDACVCLLDGVNCLADERSAGDCFKGVSLFLRPGGAFLFDLITPYQFKNGLDGHAFVYEDERDLLIWRSAMRGALCRFELDLFARDGALWRREQAEIIERAWQKDEIAALLDSAGLALHGIFADRSFDAPEPHCRRVHVLAAKPQ